MKIAVVGLGSIGCRHARNFRALGVSELSGVDPTPERRERFVSEFGGKAFADLDEALAAAPDLAVIASPNRFHIAQSLTAARAGVHLLVEKPLGISLDGANDLVAEVERRRLFAHVGSNWKFHPAFVEMKRLLAAGAVGRVTGAQVLAGQYLPDWHPWEDYRNGYSARADLGGGVIFDSHEFDYLTWLLGPVDAVKGFITTSGSLEISTEDVAVAALRFSSGALATVHLDYIQRAYRRTYHISGDRGTLEWNVRTGVIDHYDAESQKTTQFDVSHRDINDMYVDQARHVLEGITNGAAPMTPLAQATRVLEIQLRLLDRLGQDR